MQKLACPKGGASHLTFSPDGDILAGLAPAGAPTTFYCWTRSRDWEITGLEPKARLTGLAFHPTGRTLAYAGISNSLLSTPAPPPPPPGAPPPSIWRRRFARQTPRPFTGIHLYPLTGIDEVVPNRLGVPDPEGAVVRPEPETWARGLCFTPDGQFLLAGHVAQLGFSGTQANVYHWHFTETDGVWQVAEPVAAVGATEHGGALIGGYLALAGQWGVAVCPVAPGDLFVPDVQSASAVAVAPQSELVAKCERGESIYVRHLRNGKPVAVITAPGWVIALALSPDGRTLAAGDISGSVSFWDALSGEPGPERDFGVGSVTALVYAPDGLTLAVAGQLGVVVVDTD